MSIFFLSLSLSFNPSLLSLHATQNRKTKKLSTHQLPRHDLAHVDEVEDEPVLLPVHAVDLPRERGAALALVALGDDVAHLGLEVLDGVLDLVPAGRRALVLEAAAEGHFVVVGGGWVWFGRRERKKRRGTTPTPTEEKIANESTVLFRK